MTDAVKLCNADALDSGDMCQVDVDGRLVLAALIGDEWFAIDDTCSHAKVSLSDGILDEDDLTVECPRHGALFSLEDGSALTLPATRPVQTHSTEVHDGVVYVTIGAEAS